MNEIRRKILYEEKMISEPHEIIQLKNQQKLKLRKNKISQILLKKRQELLEYKKMDFKTDLKQELKFKINNMVDSGEQIFAYLNSNNMEFIKYSINELKFYFEYNFPNENEQKIIIDNKLFTILLNLGNKFIKLNDIEQITQILWILINIQLFEKGSKDYFKDLYEEEYMTFYNKCFSLYGAKEDEIMYEILNILINLIENDHYNLKILRADVISSILNGIKKANIAYSDNIKAYLKLIVKIVRMALDNEDLLQEDDKKILDKCFYILISWMFASNNNEMTLKLTYKGLYYFSGFNDKFKYNKNIINQGVTYKILKQKYYALVLNDVNKKMIDYAFRIITNNLTASDKDCKLLYDLNIRDFYDNNLQCFDKNQKIVKSILNGFSNISVGSKRDIIKDSIIWSNEKIQYYCSMNAYNIIYYIKIVKNLIYHADDETLKFIYNTKILQYFLFLMTNGNNNMVICSKILRLINTYLSKFSDEKKETEEYRDIYIRLIDFFKSVELINTIDDQELIETIEENIKTNYNQFE